MFPPLNLNDIPAAEILQYVGRGAARSAEMEALARSCMAELAGSCSPKYIWRSFGALPSAGGVTLEGAELILPGKNIAALLEGCNLAVLLGATLGAEADALLRRTQYSDMARALVLEACAAAAVEAVCDRAEGEIAEKYPARALTARYSPGYGDFPLELQNRLLGLLDAPRRIGLNATPEHLLLPRKSVTAVIGIKNRA